MSYSEQIKRIRADLLVTQTELAEMLGVTFATINRWERGTTNQTSDRNGR